MSAMSATTRNAVKHELRRWWHGFVLTTTATGTLAGLQWLSGDPASERAYWIAFGVGLASAVGALYSANPSAQR